MREKKSEKQNNIILEKQFFSSNVAAVHENMQYKERRKNFREYLLDGKKQNFII